MRRRSRHGDRVWIRRDDGSTSTLPTQWTSLATPDAFTTIAAGRAAFRTEDLVRLVGLVDALRGAGECGGGADDV